MNKDSARLSQGAYKGVDVEGYTIDHRLSNEYGTVYVSNKTGRATVAYSGTQFNAPGKKIGGKVKRAAKDIWADLHIASGTEQDSEEFRKASSQFEEVQKQYGKGNVDVTGHSLGGSKAMYISSTYGAHADVYNPGWTPEGALFHSTFAGKVRKAVTGKKGYAGNFKNVDVYTTPLDFASPATHIPGQGFKTHTVITDETKKQVVDIPKGTVKSTIAKTAAKSGFMAGGGAEAAAALNPFADVAVAAVGAYKLAKKAVKLHSIDQFVNTREKPVDSKPSTPNPMPPQQIQKPAPPPPIAVQSTGIQAQTAQPHYRAHVLRNG